ncbi:MAG: hypothetical protein KC503_05895 [Myxococcales bacterium]|nr:hypothetical protein [Myxococcales bacterium]
MASTRTITWCARCAGALALALLLVGCPGARRETGADTQVTSADVGPAFGDIGSGDSFVPVKVDSGVEAGPACNAASCAGGCCAADDTCQPGSVDTACGKGGAQCANCTLVSGSCSSNYCLGCSPSCSGKNCGSSDGCGGTCTDGSGCCTPACSGKLCGASDGCGGSCASGSGCCTPSCAGKTCGSGDGCGGTCGSGSGCCTPSCQNKICGEADGCGGSCAAGSGCCVKQTEVLDGKDNDCDGEIDEGYWANAHTVSYATLTAEHPSCTQSSAHSDNCMAAAHRYCTKQGFKSGIGPVEFGPSDAVVICLADAKTFPVPIGTLTAEHGSCTAQTFFSLWCNSSIHRWCGKQAGYQTGAGPVEHSATVSHVVCLKHTKTYQVSFATLASHHAGCSAGASFSPACKAAIHRYCTSQGHESGWGPVEQNADAFVICLDAN